jgi:hypothetical protein
VDVLNIIEPLLTEPDECTTIEEPSPLTPFPATIETPPELHEASEITWMFPDTSLP